MKRMNDLLLGQMKNLAGSPFLHFSVLVAINLAFEADIINNIGLLCFCNVYLGFKNYFHHQYSFCSHLKIFTD